MKRFVLTALILLKLAGVATAQQPFAVTDSEARLSQRSTIAGDFNLDSRSDTIYQARRPARRNQAD